ncbi:MAG: hypothetical protein ABW252_07155 [Polyangiales bacterium]
MQRHGRLMLAVMNETAPTDAQWQRWLELAAERIGKDLRAIIEVYGGVGPNARQRQAMTPLLGKLDPRTAVMSDSLLVRGLVTAVSWLGIPNAAFGMGQHEAAARYLELTPDELAFARDRLASLRRAAGVPDAPGP